MIHTIFKCPRGLGAEKLGSAQSFGARMRRAAPLFAFIASLCSLGAVSALAEPSPEAKEARLLRFPAVHGDRIVFGYAGDLYAVAKSGGVARRMTGDEGYEMFPRFSPDGNWIAFTGQYDGNTEAYLMPASGGVPKRLTHTATLDRDDVSDRMGPNNIVMTWKDNQTLVMRSRRTEWNDFLGQLYLVSTQEAPLEQLPLPRGGWCSFSPDKKKLAYNRVFREFRTWKRYRGGQADDIWIYDFEAKTTVNLTANPAQDIFPMWHGNRIYFVSDRDENKRLNLFVTDLSDKSCRQLTHFTQFDVKFPSLGDKDIVFENGGYIYTFDLAAERLDKVSIQIQEDLAIGRDRWKDVSREINHFDLSPDGNRALFNAHGDVFTVPQKYGNVRNLTATPGVHDRDAAWSPDGRSIAYISDASGEDEIWIQPQDGRSPAKALTKNSDTYKYELVWSPDSAKILWSDKKQRLQYVDVESGRVVPVAQAVVWEIRDYTWAPDSRWIAYTQPEANQLARIYLYSVATEAKFPATDEWFSSDGPEFSPDGKFLYFVSNRNFEPRSSQTEWNHAYFDMAGLFFITLTGDVKSPFAPKSDEVAINKAGEKEKDSKTAKEGAKDDKKVMVKVEREGLMSRIGSIPVGASGYGNLQATDGRLYYTRQGLKDEKRRLFVFDFEKQKETELGDVGSFKIAADRKKMLVRADDSYAIIDLPASRIEVKDRLDLGKMQVFVDRRAEWDQIFRECWRQMRDFFYLPNMHGVNWEAMKANYEPLVAHVSHRADLTYVIGEMIGELNIGHAYVGGGDYPKAPRIQTGLLGAQIELDPKSGFHKITKILQGENWSRGMRSPLTEMGVKASEGDYILAVDGKSTSGFKDFYRALIQTAGRQVTLKLNKEPRQDGAWETVVIPIADERPLYYLNWVQKNIDTVTKQTDGQIGYIHIPNMGTEGLNEFVKHFYPQVNKKGLIVDVRGNGGGNVSPTIIERLRRELVMYSIARNSAINTDPSAMVLGPKVMLMDEFSASDGDIVCYRFRKAKLGTLIGKRTWGGVVGIRGSLPLLDGGSLNRPEFSRYNVEGTEWVMEGKGVEPDIFVDNDPAREFAGVDDQLNKAIDVIKEELKRNPVRIVPPPPWPDKSK
jgi:tricorn protease